MMRTRHTTFQVQKLDGVVLPPQGFALPAERLVHAHAVLGRAGVKAALAGKAYELKRLR